MTKKEIELPELLILNVLKLLCCSYGIPFPFAKHKMLYMNHKTNISVQNLRDPLYAQFQNNLHVSSTIGCKNKSL